MQRVAGSIACCFLLYRFAHADPIRLFDQIRRAPLRCAELLSLNDKSRPVCDWVRRRETNVYLNDPRLSVSDKLLHPFILCVQIVSLFHGALLTDCK